MFPSWSRCLVDVSVKELWNPSWPLRTGVDLAKKTRPGTVFFSTARNPVTGLFVPVEIVRGRFAGPQVLKQMDAVWNRIGRLSHDFSFHVEDNGLQGWIFEWLESDSETSGKRYPWEKKIFPISTQGYNKNDPDSGLPSLEVEYNNGGWAIPFKEFKHHSTECDCGWCAWRRESASYPACFGDTVMGGWFSREGHSRKKKVGKWRRLSLKTV